MAHSIQKRVKFSKGQISPYLVERTDVDMFDSSAQIMKNVTSNIYGGVRSRRGTSYIDVITDNDEILPSTVTSDVYSSTTHLTDLEETDSNTVNNNKLIAKIDYGTSDSDSGYIALKGLKIKEETCGDVEEVIEEYTTSQATFNKDFPAGTYRFSIVGAGGGGATYYRKSGNNWNGNGGGSGAYIQGISSFSSAVTAVIVVGKGGAHATGGGGVSGSTGGKSEIRIGTSYLRANAGTGGASANWGAGVGGTYTNNGFSGVTGTNGNSGVNVSVTGASSVHNGYGAGGNGQTYGNNSSGSDGGDGYLKAERMVAEMTVELLASNDDIDYESLGTYKVTAFETSGFIRTKEQYRYLKLMIVDDSSLNFQIQLKYIKQLKATPLQSNVKLIPFSFNNEQKNIIVVADDTLQIFQDDSLVQIIENTGISGSIIPEIDYTMQDDTIIITHSSIQPKQLQRTNTGWVLSSFPYKNIPYFAFGGETSTTKTVSITPSAVEGPVKITASSSVFDSGYVGQYIDGNGGRVKVTEYVSGTVVNGVTIIPFYTTDAISSWTYISGYQQVWGATHGYPRTCLFAQQRLWFGGSRDLPAHVWASRVDDYNNFKNAGNYDNDAIDISLATNNPVYSMVENRGVHIFTAGEEWFAGEESLTPDSISVKCNSKNGSKKGIKPVIIGGTICFVEKNGKSLLSYVYSYDQASYITDNLSIFSDLVQQPVDMSVEANSSRDKGDFLFVVLEDGTMLVGCVALTQNIFSISQFVTDGEVKAVATLVDSTYLLVERNDIITLEKISNVQTDSTMEIFIDDANVSHLNIFSGDVWVYNDNRVYGKYSVDGGNITMETVPNEMCKVGASFNYEIQGNPIAINNKTITCKKRISKATVYCSDTKELELNGQKKKGKDVYEFYACTPYKDDVRFDIKGVFTPMNILSVTLDINYEG